MSKLLCALVQNGKTAVACVYHLGSWVFGFCLFGCDKGCNKTAACPCKDAMMLYGVVLPSLHVKFACFMASMWLVWPCATTVFMSTYRLLVCRAS